MHASSWVHAPWSPRIFLQCEQIGRIPLQRLDLRGALEDETLELLVGAREIAGT